MTEDFENAMAEHAMVIFRERQKTVSRLSDQITEIYEKISGREKETLRLQYRSFAAGSDHPKQEMLRVLRENREEDMRLSQTSCGPHRDDLVITLNQKDMKVFASQGQVRTAALCFRLSQLNVLESFGGERPVLLMDDVMSELDKQRRMNLLKEIGDTQTFITFSDESDLDAMEEKRSYYVFSRGGTAVVEEKSSGTVQKKFILKEPDFT
jgi:DNA replication and repair protein RecF